MKRTRILIACEFSGIVREAFRALGADAISCDLEPAEDGRNNHHFQGDVRDILGEPWDMLIAFPPCTYLCNSGVRWLDRGANVERMAAMRQACGFFNLLLGATHIPHVCVENPIQHKYAREHIRKPDQIIQPWQHGHGESKATCLWLKDLPLLTPSQIVSGRSPRVHHASPGPNRWKERSRTLPGIAAALASKFLPIVAPSPAGDAHS